MFNNPQTTHPKSVPPSEQEVEESLVDSSRGVVLFNSIVNAVVQNRGKLMKQEMETVFC